MKVWSVWDSVVTSVREVRSPQTSIVTTSTRSPHHRGPLVGPPSVAALRARRHATAVLRAVHRCFQSPPARKYPEARRLGVQNGGAAAPAARLLCRRVLARCEGGCPSSQPLSIDVAARCSAVSTVPSCMRVAAGPRPRRPVAAAARCCTTRRCARRRSTLRAAGCASCPTAHPVVGSRDPARRHVPACVALLRDERRRPRPPRCVQPPPERRSALTSSHAACCAEGRSRLASSRTPDARRAARARHDARPPRLRLHRPRCVVMRLRTRAARPAPVVLLVAAALPRR